MKNSFIKMIVGLAGLLVPIASFAGTMKDSRDGKTYRTVEIRGKEWMAENLNFDYNHGTAKSMCYENKPENCEKYGRLYTWAAAMDGAAVFGKDGEHCGYNYKCYPKGAVRGVCPEGWHLPSKEEFEELSKMAGNVLRSQTGWADDGGKSGNGTESQGFAVLPAGYVENHGTRFFNVGKNAKFWSSSEDGWYDAYRMSLNYYSESADVYYGNKGDGFSVRCIKN